MGNTSLKTTYRSTAKPYFMRLSGLGAKKRKNAPKCRFSMHPKCSSLNCIIFRTATDPACGTGGFLTSTIAHIGSVQTTEELEKLQTSINGWEKKPLPYLLAMTNLILHDIEIPRIRHQNSLNRPLSDYSAKDRVDVIVANPPFGGAEDAAVKQNFPGDMQTSETADLFMALIMNLLKDHGRAGVVLPDGFMFGDGVKATIKEKLLKEYGLHTIIRLPQVFKPYANVNTNLLFFQKGVTSRGVWFYRLDYPEGVKSFTKTKPMQDYHFDSVREWWKDKQEITVDGFDKAKFYTVDDLVALNYDFNKCCPFPHVEEEILEPKDLIARYEAERAELSSALDSVVERLICGLDSKSVPNDNSISDISSKLIKLQVAFPEKLRKSILQQAIMGNLTECEPTDEPASELLRRIRTEKEKLIKEGKIKKEKPLPPISEDEIPFEIPDTWEWVRLGEVFDVNPRNNVLDDTEVGFIPMPLLEPGFVNKHTFERKLWKEVKKNFTHFQKLHLVFKTENQQ